jgi:RNA polymerase sigma-70 factor, ECF subfamily
VLSAASARVITHRASSDHVRINDGSRENCVKTRRGLRAKLRRTMSSTATLTADLGAHRAHLLRFARRRINDTALAEDLVQDVFTAVIEGRASFGERASLRTWLIGILKHKIVDAVRGRAGECSLDALCDEEGKDASAWTHLLASDDDEPSRRVELRQRLADALARIEALPAHLRRVFELRVLLDHDTAEVCSALSISQGDLWVRVHRARRRLAD